MKSWMSYRACERSVSGAENEAERAENRVSGSGAVSGKSAAHAPLTCSDTDIRGGPQDLCKFSLAFMPAPIYYVHRYTML